ncbi:MAG TPA: hypothetical protein VMY59_08505 [Candidatus Thermoplasmatota archaeon]|nr:hypothetical protein [Candidatus Thermoplasmatota archaeon]
MQKQAMIIGILFLLIIAGLSGCNQVDNERNKFIGTWISELKQNPMGDNTYTETRIFYENDSYVTTNMGLSRIPGTWHLANDILVIDTYFPGKYDYIFSQNNSILTITSVAGGFTENLTKQ